MTDVTGAEVVTVGVATGFGTVVVKGTVVVAGELVVAVLAEAPDAAVIAEGAGVVDVGVEDVVDAITAFCGGSDGSESILNEMSKNFVKKIHLRKLGLARLRRCHKRLEFCF